MTVLLPVFDCESYVGAAVESVLDQTFDDFELLVIDDGSRDASRERVLQIRDPRIRVVVNKRNLGLVATLNRGLKLAQGEFVARMDADDLCLPQRLERQVGFLDQRPDVGVIGNWVRVFGGLADEVWRYSSDPEELRASLLFRSELAHPTVMMRKEVLARNGLVYDPAYPHAEDYALWARASETTALANLDEVLVLRRIHSEAVGARRAEEQTASASRIRADQLCRLGLVPDPQDLEIHRAVSTGHLVPSRAQVVAAERWLRQLLAANAASHRYDAAVFSRVVQKRWAMLCAECTSLGMWLWRRYVGSPLRMADAGGVWFSTRLMARCIRSGWEGSDATPP